MSPNLEKLLSLQEVDLSVQQLQTNLEKIAVERKQIEDQLISLSIDYNEAKESFEYIRKEYYKGVEIPVLSQKNDRNHPQEFLELNNKDLKPHVLGKIDYLQEKILELETQITTQMKVLEVLKKQEKYASEQLNMLKAKRHTATSNLPEGLLKIYERIKSHNSVVLAEVINNFCESCRMIIPYVVRERIRHEEYIVMCNNCGRILYCNPVNISAYPRASAE